MTYPEFMTDYMKTALKKIWNEIPDCDDFYSLTCWVWDYFWNEDKNFHYQRNIDEAKEMVVANVEYVMRSVKENCDSLEEKSKWFLESDWLELDYSALATALEDVHLDVAEWIVEEKK